MRTRSQQTNPGRWLLVFLAALVGVLAVIGLAGTASANERGVSQNRVGAFNVAGEVLVEPPQRETAGQHLGRADDSAEIVVATGVAAEGGSALSRASQATFRAAANPGLIFVKKKHLASAGGNGAKFATDDIGQAQGWISRGLQSDGVQFLPNQLDDTFRAIVPGGGVVGARGQEFIRVIVTGDGRVINAFPVNVR